MAASITTKEEFEHFITHNWNEVNSYIDHKMKEVIIPIYSSVDIRESTTKFAPVDLNIYPAGFNNLCHQDLSYATELFATTLKSLHPETKTIGIIPESHTKNLFYLDNLAMLGKCIRDAGFDVHFISFDENLFENDTKVTNLISHSKFEIRLEFAEASGNKILSKENAQPMDVCILNHDQSKPMDIEWEQIQTPIYPSPHIGWYKRQKNRHFMFYKQVADEFCQNFGINADLIQAKFSAIENVDFSSKEGFDTIAKGVDELIAELPLNSNVFVKASQGTYGMGISVVSSGDEVISMNRKTRNKMDLGKNKIKFTSVLLQEGIKTALEYDNMPAEIAIYLVNGKSAGGFMRVNSLKTSDGNLNSKGMVFKKFCISEIRQDQEHKSKEAVYSIIARLATLASGHEIREVQP